MKYTITAPETDSPIASLERFEGAAGLEWEIVLAGEKGAETKSRLGGVRVALADGQLEFAARNGMRQVYPAFRNEADGVFVVATALGNFRLLPTRGAAHEGTGAGKSGSRSIKSSMPGKVLKLLCAVGDTIAAGQPLLIIEAMKMENEIRSPRAGKVDEIGVAVGQSIMTGDLLVKLGGGDKS